MVGEFELVLLAAWSFAVAFAGGLAGLVLGNLRLPLVVLVATSPSAGAGANLGISAVAAITAAGAHAKAGRVDWKLFAWMAPPSLAGGVVGGLLSGVLPERALLGAIAAVLIYSAFEVTRGRRGAEARTSSFHWRRALVTGFGVGVLGGLVGLILGALRLPAMLGWVGVGTRAAVGTNAAIGVAVGVAGLAGHLPSGVDWSLLAVSAIASIPGALLGARLTGRLDERALLRAVGAILALAGLAMAIQAINLTP